MFIRCISLRFPQPSFDIEDVESFRYIRDGVEIWHAGAPRTYIPLSDYRVVISQEPLKGKGD